MFLFLSFSKLYSYAKQNTYLKKQLTTTIFSSNSVSYPLKLAISPLQSASASSAQFNQFIDTEIPFFEVKTIKTIMQEQNEQTTKKITQLHIKTESCSEKKGSKSATNDRIRSRKQLRPLNAKDNRPSGEVEGERSIFVDFFFRKSNSEINSLHSANSRRPQN